MATRRITIALVAIALVALLVIGVPGGALASSSASFKNGVLGTSPFAYWGIGETSGTTGAAIDHVGGRNGNFVPATNGNTFVRGATGAPVPDRWDEGVTIEDVANLNTGGGQNGGYVNVPAVNSSVWGMQGRQAFTVNIWVRWDGYRVWNGGDTHQGIIGNLGDANSWGWGIYISAGTPGNGKLRFLRKATGSGGVIAPAALPLNQWTMVTATYDGTTQRLYQNGQLVASATDTKSLQDGHTALSIGRLDFNNSFSGYWAYFHGSLDEPAIWKTALSAAQVTSLYIAPLDIPFAQTLGGPGGEYALNPALYEAEPVNTATGSYFTETTDVSLAGIGVPFAFERVYNSSDATAGLLGRGWTHSYNALLIVAQNGDVTARAGNGQQVKFTRKSDGTYTAPPGARMTLTSITGGYELRRVDQVSWRFDTQGRLTSVRDRNQQGITCAYSPSGALSTATDAAGRTVSFTYNGEGRLSQVALPDGRATTYSYQGGLLSSVVDARGNTTSYTYDAAGRLASIVDQNQHQVVQNTYDSMGRVIEQTDARGNTGTFSWDPATETSTFTDARGKVWRDEYFRNVIQQQTDPLGNTTKFTYDADGNVTKVIDPRGNPTTMTYDIRGNLLTRTQAAPFSATESFTYNSFNDPLTHTDFRGHQTSYGYDSAGNLTTVTQPGNTTTHYGYDPNGKGLLTSVQNANGKTTSLGYDSAGDLTSVTTPLGNQTTFGYDAAGRRIWQVDPRGNAVGANPDDYTTLLAYDPLNHLTAVTDPLGNVTSYTYDGAGNRASVVDPRGNATPDPNDGITNYSYYADNRLQIVTAPDQSTTTYGYDSVGNLTSRVDGNQHETDYEYDAANRLSKVTRPLGKVWTYSYDANGNVTTSVDANGNATTDPADGTTTFGYDNLNRLTSIIYSDSTPSVSYGYDANGYRASMSDGTGQVAYTYDDLDRLTQLTRGTDSFAYSYDPASNVTERAYPGSLVADYTYDDDGRLGTVTSGGQTTAYGYNAAGELTSTTLPAANGYLDTRSYDRAGRLTAARNASGGTALSFSDYSYDADGLPTQLTSQEGVTTYGYDTRNRLNDVCFQPSCPNSSDPFIRYTYDAVGNRLTEDRPTGSTTYTYDAADQLQSTAAPAGTTNYGYDTNGNETAAGSRTFTYDLANRLASTTSSGTTTSYSYDGDGNRLSASSGPNAADTINYLWDVNNGLPQLALERDGSGALLRSYLYGLNRLAMNSGGSPFYYHYDLLGSVANVTSGTGGIEWSYSYEPFGATRNVIQDDPAAPDNQMRFTGELYDSGIGMYDLRAREYDPATGRFLRTDPLAPQLGDLYVASYTYANNAPTIFTDPSGLCWTQLCWVKHGADWAVHHPDIVVDAAAVTCVVATGGGCAPLAFAAVATTVSTSAYNNGIIGNKKPNYGRFAADLAVTGATFGAGSLVGIVFRSEFFVVAASDRALLTRVSAAGFFDLDLLIAGVRGELSSSVGRNGK